MRIVALEAEGEEKIVGTGARREDEEDGAESSPFSSPFGSSSDSVGSA